MKNINKLIQRIRNSTLIRSSGIYTITSFINASIPFLLLPILTKYLSPDDFGIVTMFTTMAGFLQPFISLNMEGAIARVYYKQNVKITDYVGGCILISLLCSLFCLFMILLFGDVLVKYVAIPKVWLILVVILCFSQFLILILLSLYQVCVRPAKYGCFQIGFSLVNFGLSFLLIAVFNMKWEGRLIAIVFSTTLFSLLALGLLMITRSISFNLKKEYLVHAIKFGGYLIPHTIGGLLIVLTNRFFLVKMSSLHEVGLYSTANQVASIISFLTISFNNAFVPWLYKKLTQNEWRMKIRIVRLTYSYFIIIICLGTLLIVISPLIFKWFIAPAFYSAVKYCFWIILGFCFQGMYFMVTNYISFAEKTYYQAIVTLSIGILNIAINYFAIKMFGPIGAAMSFCICFVLLFVFTWFLSAKVYKMPWTIVFKKE